MVVLGGDGYVAVSGRSDEQLRERLVSVWVNPFLPQLLLNARVPQVLYLVVSPSGQLSRNLRPPLRESKLHDQMFLFI